MMVSSLERPAGIATDSPSLASHPHFSSCACADSVSGQLHVAGVREFFISVGTVYFTFCLNPCVKVFFK